MSGVRGQLVNGVVKIGESDSVDPILSSVCVFVVALVVIIVFMAYSYDGACGCGCPLSPVLCYVTVCYVMLRYVMLRYLTVGVQHHVFVHEGSGHC